MTTRGTQRAWLKRAAYSVAAVLCLILLAVSTGPTAARWMLFEMPFMWHTFTPEAWAQAGCNGLTDTACANKAMTCPRGAMVSSLIRRHLIVGKTSQSEVFQLLGSPERPIGQDGCGHYVLGMCSGLGFDYDALYVCFDSQGTLISSGHRQG